MLLSTFALVFVLVCAGIGSARAQTAGSSPAPSATLAAADNAVGFDLLKNLSLKSGDDNLFISPTSITQAIGLLYIGSAGTSQREIATTLHLHGIEQSTYDQGSTALLGMLTKTSSNLKVSVANALWSQTGHPFSSQYAKRSQEDFSAIPHSVDFTEPTEAARTINSWVSANTGGKITTLVSPDSVGNASMVLTNAAYFKGIWTDPFDPSLTQPAPFAEKDGTVTQIPTMSRTGIISVYSDPSITVLSLPYSGTPATSMIIILPTDGGSAVNIAESMTPDILNDWLSKLAPREIELFLPKFHIDSSLDLVSPLKDLGMKAAFTRAADFSPTGLVNTYVSDVIHKSTLDVDEEGTTASAATGVIMRALAMPRPLVVRIDHPFLCAIEENTSGALLFLGIVNHPQSEN